MAAEPAAADTPSQGGGRGAPELSVVSGITAAEPVPPPGEESEAEGWLAHLRPPDVWSGPIPPLSEQWARLREGAHLPDGPAAAWAVWVCLALATVLGMAAVLLHWAAASPARLAALALVGAAAGVVVWTLLSFLLPL